MDIKCCSKCLVEKPLSEFNKQTKGQFGVTSKCKTCKIQYRQGNYINIKKQQDTWRQNNRAYDLSKKKRYYELNKEQKRRSDLRNKFKMTLEEYNIILESQNFVCAICHQPETAKGNNGNIKPLAVDHCHSTGKIRGLLCMFCNTGLGKFKDDVVSLQSAVDYILKHS